MDSLHLEQRLVLNYATDEEIREYKLTLEKGVKGLTEDRLEEYFDARQKSDLQYRVFVERAEASSTPASRRRIAELAKLKDRVFSIMNGFCKVQDKTQFLGDYEKEIRDLVSRHDELMEQD